MIRAAARAQVTMNRGGLARSASASSATTAAFAENWRATASAACAASVCIQVLSCGVMAIPWVRIGGGAERWSRGSAQLGAETLVGLRRIGLFADQAEQAAGGVAADFLVACRAVVSAGQLWRENGLSSKPAMERS